MYASFAFATGHFAKMGFVFYLLALSVSGITGWSIAWIIIGLGIITIFYTLVGGLRGVIWTDVAQGFILWMSVAVTICLLLFSSHAGAGNMLRLIISHHKMDLGGWNFNLAKPTFWTMAIYGLFFYLQKYTADQTVVQRYLAAKSDRSSLRGMLMGASLCLPIWTAFMLIGSLLWAFYRITGEALPGTMTRPDQVFPHYMVTHMPIGVAGLFLAALFGAAMSMLASDLNCLGLILVEDFYAHFFPRKSDVQRLSFGKLSIVFCGGLAIAVALRLSTTQGSALALYYTATAIVAGGLAGLFLLAFLCRRAGRAAAILSIWVSLLFTAWATLTLNGGKLLNLHRYNYPWHEYTIGAIGNVLLLIVGLLVAFVYPAASTASSRLTLWDWMDERRQARLQAIPQEHP